MQRHKSDPAGTMTQSPEISITGYQLTPAIGSALIAGTDRVHLGVGGAATAAHGDVIEL